MPISHFGFAPLGYWLRRRLIERTNGAPWAPMWSGLMRPRPISKPPPYTPNNRASPLIIAPLRRKQLVIQGETFDAILNMEVIEHVADPQAFMTACRAIDEARKPLCFWRPSTARMKAFALWPLSGRNMCCAGCRAAPMNGINSSPRQELDKYGR